MLRLFGAPKLVLQAIRDSPKDAAGFVTDAQIAQSTQMVIGDVRDFIEILEGDELVDVVRREEDFSVAINARGRQALRRFRPMEYAAAKLGHSVIDFPCGTTSVFFFLSCCLSLTLLTAAGLNLLGGFFWLRPYSFLLVSWGFCISAFVLDREVRRHRRNTSSYGMRLRFITLLTVTVMMLVGLLWIHSLEVAGPPKFPHFIDTPP